MGIEKDVVRESGTRTIGKDGKEIKKPSTAQPPDTKKEKLNKGGDK